MGTLNERGAGRKRSISKEKAAELKKRHAAGESVASLARECGVSRQTLSGYLNAKEKNNLTADTVCKTLQEWNRINRMFREEPLADYTMRIDYMCKTECCTTILVNFKSREIRICNQTDNLLYRAFGVKVKPDWKDFEEFLESRCFPRTRDHLKLILEDLGLDAYDPLAIVEKTKGRMAEDFQWMRIMRFQREG